MKLAPINSCEKCCYLKRYHKQDGRVIANLCTHHDRQSLNEMKLPLEFEGREFPMDGFIPVNCPLDEESEIDKLKEPGMGA